MLKAAGCWCRQGLTPTDHAKQNRQAIKQMSLRNKETRQQQQQDEAHKVRAISRPAVKTPVASRRALFVNQNVLNCLDKHLESRAHLPIGFCMLCLVSSAYQGQHRPTTSETPDS